VPNFLHSRTVQILGAVAGLFLFYLLGVVVRKHSGVAILIHNETTGTIQDLSVEVGNDGTKRSLHDLAPGDQERVFVATPQQSSISVEFTEPGRKPHTIDVFDHAKPGDCGSSNVRILPQRRTESYETHQSVSWKGWLDLL
jgi:hypothetical protein